jgi:hypothetical protein
LKAQKDTSINDSCHRDLTIFFLAANHENTKLLGLGTAYVPIDIKKNMTSLNNKITLQGYVIKKYTKEIQLRLIEHN